MDRLGLTWLSLLLLQILFVHAFAKVSQEPALSPVAPKPQRGVEQHDQFKDPSTKNGPAPTPAETPRGGQDSEASQAPMISVRKLSKHHSDSSVAGGEVIMGGLLIAIFAAVFCYIRVTRKRRSTDATGDH